MGEYIKTDEWTTQDGEVEPSDKPYSINKVHADRMKEEKIDGEGCAICFFVKLEGGPADTVHYITTAGYVEEHLVDAKRWAHISMFNPGSGYNPTNNVGPWTATAKGVPSEALDGIGLPGGWHVSTFKVLTWQEQDTAPTLPPVDSTPTPEPVPEPDTIQAAVKVGNSTYQGVLRKVVT